jgi:sulfatase modifying factor 1
VKQKIAIGIAALLFAACGGGSASGGGDLDAGADADTDTDTDAGADGGDTDTGSDTGSGPCPPEMALAGDACVDRWEAHLVDWSPYDAPDDGVASAEAGAVPQGYISGAVAQLACAAAGKRLCALDEWLRACQGPDGSTWPYGDAYVDGACNDT